MSESKKKILILAGEESGDLHASNLVKAFHSLPDPPRIFGFGGAHMQNAGVELVKNTLRTSVVGVSEVIRALPALLRQEKEIRNWLLNHPMDLVIMVDFPGFHLKLLPHIAPLYPTVYFIPPKVWVWKENRKETILKFCEKVYTIFPFEKRYFKEKTEYFGHPSIDMVKAKTERTEFLKKHELDPEVSYIGLVPGSRKQEIDSLLPIMLDTARKLKERQNVRFLIPAPDSVSEGAYDVIHRYPDVSLRLIRGETYELLKSCDLILATSGTVTLEAAILGVPMIIINRGSFITYMAFKALSKVKFLGLPNIILNREACPEMIQNDANPKSLSELALQYLRSEAVRKEQKKELNLVRESLGEPGVAMRIASHMQQEFLT